MKDHKYLEAAEYIDSQREHIAERIMQDGGIYLYKDYSKYQIDKCRQDTLYNLQYLAEAMRIESPRLWDNYVIWLRTLLSSLGLRMPGLAQHFKTMGDVLGSLLDPPAGHFVKLLTDSAAKLVLEDDSTRRMQQDAPGKFTEQALRVP